MKKAIIEILKFLFFVTFAIVHGIDKVDNIDMDNIEFDMFKEGEK